MSSIRGTPSYWKQFFVRCFSHDKKVGYCNFFLSLSCADLKWDELTRIIYKLNNSTSFDDDLKNLTYEERFKYLNNNPVLVAYHLQYRFQVIFKEILFDGPLSKTSYYVNRVEFQIRRSPNIHLFMWIQKAAKFTPETEEEYMQFVEKLMSAKLPDPVSEPELYDM